MADYGGGENVYTTNGTERLMSRSGSLWRSKKGSSFLDSVSLSLKYSARCSNNCIKGYDSIHDAAQIWVTMHMEFYFGDSRVYNIFDIGDIERGFQSYFKTISLAGIPKARVQVFRLIIISGLVRWRIWSLSATLLGWRLSEHIFSRF